MGDKSKIEWPEATWNPIVGCSKVSEGCRNCYAITVANRFNGNVEAYEGLTKIINGKPEWTGNLRFVKERLLQPMKWKRPRMIFVNSMSDLFHENIADSLVAEIFAIMAMCPKHTFQVLTKRAKRMWSFLNLAGFRDLIQLHLDQFSEKNFGMLKSPYRIENCWPLPNVWLGVSVEDQQTADERIPLLLQTPAAVRWISAEPLLERITVEPWLGTQDEDGHDLPAINWVVAGGESGPHARPSHIDWFRALRDDCLEYDVPFFLKQWGEWRGSARVGKRIAGRVLDGVEWNQYPNLS